MADLKNLTESIVKGNRAEATRLTQEAIDGGVDGGKSSADGGKSGADAATQSVLSQLVDQDGVPFQLKGVSSDWLNWETKPFAESQKALQYMRDNWKLSVIRASMGIDLKTGGYMDSPADMKSKVESIIQHAIALGVYVLVDWHTEKAVNQQAASVAFFTEAVSSTGLVVSAFAPKAASSKFSCDTRPTNSSAPYVPAFKSKGELIAAAE